MSFQLEALDEAGTGEVSKLHRSLQRLSQCIRGSQWGAIQGGNLGILRDPSSSPYGSNISCWDVSQVSDMSFAFRYKDYLTEQQKENDEENYYDLELLNDKLFETFNRPLNCWNTSNVRNMSYMFDGAEEFEQDLSFWDVSNVLNMRHMFDGARIFNGNISAWNVANVLNMSHMFHDSDFNQTIGSWDVSRVKNMNGMFGSTGFNQDIGLWDVSSVTSMRYMFEYDKHFNQNISPGMCQEWRICLECFTLRHPSTNPLENGMYPMSSILVVCFRELLLSIKIFVLGGSL